MTEHPIAVYAFWIALERCPQAPLDALWSDATRWAASMVDRERNDAPERRHAPKPNRETP